MSQESFDKIQHPQIATELKVMRETDQSMRIKNLENEDEWDDVVDRANTERMKQIVQEIGWPTISKVGIEASESAWLLVQHADHDVDFQEECLKRLRELPEDEVSKWNIAYLEDRVRINRKQPQLYGTQFRGDPNKGSYEPLEIDDVDHLDERRKEMGLGSFEEYQKELFEKYVKPAKKKK